MVEPLSIATTFATIVSLLATYKSERRANKQVDYQDFYDWLTQNNNNKAIALLDENREISQSIRETLNNHGEILDYQLAKLNDAIGIIANKMECFSSIVEAVDFKSSLSNQAYSIVSQLVESGSTYFLEIKIMTRGGGDQYVLVGGEKQGSIDYSEPQFIEDDLLSLVERGFLRLDYGSNGSRMFYVTRAAVALVK